MTVSGFGACICLFWYLQNTLEVLAWWVDLGITSPGWQKTLRRGREDKISLSDLLTAWMQSALFQELRAPSKQFLPAKPRRKGHRAYLRGDRTSRWCGPEFPDAVGPLPPSPMIPGFSKYWLSTYNGPSQVVRLPTRTCMHTCKYSERSRRTTLPTVVVSLVERRQSETPEFLKTECINFLPE